jgi:hypothetical protein
MYAFTEVDRLCRDEHPDIRAERYHRVDLTAASTRSSVAASTKADPGSDYTGTP